MDGAGNHVDLLISLLVRFPQIATVYFEPEERALRLVFLFHDQEDDFTDFVQVFQAHLAFFHSLRQEDTELVSLKRIATTSLTSIEIVREIATLSLEELNLIATLVSEFYGDRLIEEGPEMDEDDQYEHDLVIDSFFNSGPHGSLERLTGFRDNGRVLVFSVPLVGVGKS